MIVVRERPSADWDEFVARHPEASLYHRCDWSLLTREVFGHEPRFLEARNDAGALIGILPIVRQKSLLFGNFSTSMPFFNYGGALAQSESLAQEMMLRAVEVAKDWGCSYVEFRDNRRRDGDWLVRTDKVSMVLQLPASFEELSRQLGSKLRSQVKRADREAVQVSSGGSELLDAFYDVFCRNMRDLGTPTYPRRFFEAILRRFPEQSLIVSLERGGRPAAAAFLLMDSHRAEIPWASCREDAKPLGFNMKLYWEVLSAVMSRGCTQFDFGRSTTDSSTYRFKKQWGANEVQLYWHRWEKCPSSAGVSPPAAKGSVAQRGAALWRKLPLPVANLLGPIISPSLPW